jgi:hypothetical protein
MVDHHGAWQCRGFGGNVRLVFPIAVHVAIKSTLLCVIGRDLCVEPNFSNSPGRIPLPSPRRIPGIAMVEQRERPLAPWLATHEIGLRKRGVQTKDESVHI